MARPKTSELSKRSRGEKAVDSVVIRSLLPPADGGRSSFQVVCVSCGGGFPGPEGDGGSRRPYRDVRSMASQPGPQQRTRTPRKNTGNHRFQDSRRYTIRRPVRTIWQGNAMKACRNFLNSIFSTISLSA